MSTLRLCSEFLERIEVLRIFLGLGKYLEPFGLRWRACRARRGYRHGPSTPRDLLGVKPLELPEFRCGSPALASRGSRRKPEDLVVEGSPDDSPPATARPPAHGIVRVHRFAAGRALALLHAAHSGSSPTRGKKAMSLDGAIPPEERASPEGWQGPLCPPSGASFRVARRQRLGKMRHSSDDSESLSTRAGSPNHSPDEIETQAWPSHELEEKIRKPRSEVKLTLPYCHPGTILRRRYIQLPELSLSGCQLD